MTPVDKRRTDLRIVYVVGARPDFVKMAGVIAQLRRRLPDSRHALIHCGQYYDRMMSEVFLQELGVPEPDHMLRVGSGSDAVQTARVERIEPVLLDERTDLVIVPGDVNDARGGEAWYDRRPPRGASPQLRSTMPEEIKRIVADEFSDLLFLHSDEAIENRRAEAIPDDHMYFVGYRIIDSLAAMEPRFRPLEGDLASSPVAMCS